MFARLMIVFSLVVTWGLIAAPIYGQKEKQESAEKLVEARREELEVAKGVAEKANIRAKQARSKADEASEKAVQDHRNYLTATQEQARARTAGERVDAYNEVTRAAGQTAKSRQAATEAVSQAKQLEDEARQAAASVIEIQAALRRAEETAVHVGVNPVVAKEERSADQEKRIALMQAEINKLRAESNKTAATTAGKQVGSKEKKAHEKSPPTPILESWLFLIGGIGVFLVGLIGIVTSLYFWSRRRR